MLKTETKTRKTKEKGNGEGTIYPNKNTGLLIGQYFVNGKRKSVYQKKKESKTDFKKRFTKIMNSINEGTYIEKNNETIITLAKEYIELKHADGTTSARSYKRDLETVEQIKKTCSNFCYIPIQKVTINHIENAKKEIKKYSNSVIDKMWRLLKKTFNIACSPSRKILIYNVMQDENLKKPLSIKKTKKVTALNELEYENLSRILENEEQNHPYKNVIKMQMLTGMRIGEVLARSLNDYDKRNNTFNIHNTLTEDEEYNVIWSNHTKTYNKKTQIDEGQRYLPLDNNLFVGLIKIIKEQSSKEITNPKKLLFWDYEKNTFITPNEINAWLKRINEKYNISKNSLCTHRLRHYAITHWKELGIDMSVIQYLAGHVEGSSITGDVYIDTRQKFVKNELKKVF